MNKIGNCCGFSITCLLIRVWVSCYLYSRGGVFMGSLRSMSHSVDDTNSALPSGPQTMGIMVYSFLWVMQDLYHQPLEQGFST